MAWRVPQKIPFSTGVGCHCLLHLDALRSPYFWWLQDWDVKKHLEPELCLFLPHCTLEFLKGTLYQCSHSLGGLKIFLSFIFSSLLEEKQASP